jgi:hypothetical protein
MELEMELTAALSDGNSERAKIKRRELAAAREAREKSILEKLSEAR